MKNSISKGENTFSPTMLIIDDREEFVNRTVT